MSSYALNFLRINLVKSYLYMVVIVMESQNYITGHAMQLQIYLPIDIRFTHKSTHKSIHAFKPSQRRHPPRPVYPLFKPSNHN